MQIEYVVERARKLFTTAKVAWPTDRFLREIDTYQGKYIPGAYREADALLVVVERTEFGLEGGRYVSTLCPGLECS